jgi:hypothetical protein
MHIPTYLDYDIENNNSVKNTVQITFQLLKYFYNNNVILRNNTLDEYLLNPYNSNTKECKQLYIEIDEKIIKKKYLEPTEYTDFVICTMSC